MLTTDGLMYLAVEMRKILADDPTVAEYDIWFDNNTSILDNINNKHGVVGFKSFKGRIVSHQNQSEWSFIATYYQDSNPSFKIDCSGIRTIKSNEELIDIVSIPRRKCIINHTENGIVCEFTTIIDLPWHLYNRTNDYMHKHAKKCVEIIMATGSKDEIAKMEYDSFDL